MDMVVWFWWCFSLVDVVWSSCNCELEDVIEIVVNEIQL